MVMRKVEYSLAVRRVSGKPRAVGEDTHRHSQSVLPERKRPELSLPEQEQAEMTSPECEQPKRCLAKRGAAKAEMTVLLM